jgi:hypothetical protein
MRIELPVAAADLDRILSPLFGTDAAEGRLLAPLEIQPGMYLASEADLRTPEQVVLSFLMDTSTGDSPARRTVTRVPASFRYGSVFLDVAGAALAQADRVTARGDSMSPFRIEYRTRSAQGGTLTLALDSDGTRHRFVVDARTPRTSLLPSRHNLPALEGPPFESIYGLVLFNMSRDNFDFFVDRAYGISQGSAQNFRDFHLVPHSWLRLTVSPELDDNRVDVAFELATEDGRRLPVARAPASLVGGEQFKQTVFRLMDTMTAQEELDPGSSSPFEAPYYYDDPQGGGVVEVIVRGEGGHFQVAYAVETPVQELLDVDFLAYQGQVEVPDDWDRLDPSCAELGSQAAAQGYFTVTFEASSTVRGSRSIKAPLQGPVWGSIFRSQDVIITGPLPGTSAVASFAFPDVDLREGPSPAFRIPTQLPAGDYQILGFMDIDRNAEPSDPDPDSGDPVMIPIGGFELRCAETPVTAQFAILRP